MRTAETVAIPPMEAEAMVRPPRETVPVRPFWDICWRSKRALLWMAIGLAIQGVLVLLLLQMLTP